MAKKKTTETGCIEQASAWQLPSSDIDRLLATADDPRLRALFGDDYEELRALAKASLQTARAPKRLVLMVPGILGSTIGVDGNFISRNTIWFDPTALAKGDAEQLRLDPQGRSNCTSLDVLPIVHAYLRLRLQMHGFNVEYFHYDWRQSITTLGKRLADRVAKVDSVQIVAHSMGGLVTRAALNAGAKNITQVVMLGTPNRGSFSVVEVLQGINSTLTLVDKLDGRHTVDELVKDVFSTFPSIYEMLPRPEVFDGLNLFDPANWPKNRFLPALQNLKAAQQTWTKLADVDDKRLYLIAGVEQPTVTEISKGDDTGFLYHSADDGDGTVPTKMCELPGVPTWYVPETHTGLLRNETVAKSVVDLLTDRKTNRLPSEFKPTRARSKSITFRHNDFLDDANRPRLFNGRLGPTIDPYDLPLLVESAMAMSSLPPEKALQQTQQRRDENRMKGSSSSVVDSGVATSRLTSGITFDRLTISRDLQSHLEIELYNGNIFDVPYRAVVLGLFSNVDPGGPAKTLDALTFGAVTELRSRRMFDASEGKVFVMPTGRNSLKADYVVFAGLGDYSQFAVNPDATLRTVSCNVLRTLMNCGVDEFATLIYGGSSGMSIRGSVENFVQGYIDALDALGSNDRSIYFRRLCLCEYSPDRYAELKDEAYRLGGTELCKNIRLRLNEARYPASAESIEKAVESRMAAVYQRRPKNVIYLTARFERDMDGPSPEAKDTWTLRAAMLGAGTKATVFPSVKNVNRTELDAALARLPDGLGTRSISIQKMLSLGENLIEMLFTQDFIEVMRHDLNSDDHLAIVVDESAARIPWEILPFLKLANAQKTDAKGLPCLIGGVSRRFQSDEANSLAKFLEQRQNDSTLNVLMIVNPTQDLQGADEEGARIEKILRGLDSVTLTKLEHEAATRERILHELSSGKFDVVHYAGHAFFDPVDRARSGLICSGSGPVNGMSVLSGRDLFGVTRLPSLVFFNACESGRIRKLPVSSGTFGNLNISKRKENAAKGDRSVQDSGICEAMLRGGISQFIGTYWPVGDEEAASFSQAFYTGIVQGKTVRESVILGRAAVNQLNKADLANYIHYGDPSFVVKVSS